MKPQTYFAKQVVSEDVETLLHLIRHKHYPLKIRIENIFRKTRCFFFGHDLVKDIWANQNGDHKVHIGCTRCPYFKIKNR